MVNLLKYQVSKALQQTCYLDCISYLIFNCSIKIYCFFKLSKTRKNKVNYPVFVKTIMHCDETGEQNSLI